MDLSFSHDGTSSVRNSACIAALLAAGLYADAVWTPTWAATQPPAETFDCLINPSATLKIGSPVESTLASVLVQRGDHVTKGQEIARLESSVEAATVDLEDARAGSAAEIKSRRARVDAAQTEAARAGKLQEGFTVTAQKMNELRTDLAVAQQDLAMAELNRRLADLELARAQAQLAERIIRSPVDGIVTQRVLGPGEFVHHDTQIAIIAAIDPLYVEVYPPIRLYGSVHPGDAADVLPDAPIGGRRRAVVTVVDQVFDAGSGTFGVRLELPNPDGRLPAALRCRVRFEAPAIDAASDRQASRVYPAQDAQASQ